ncbi:hypothetical protein XH79_04015 [Bradyrhizobium sp. CCBAU 45389]|nr:hypothetical protein [Bradyrhizobium sp. CCBAU 45389]
MGHLLGLEVLVKGQAGLEKRSPVSSAILLTSLRHVNRRGAEFMPQRIQNSVLGAFASTFLLPD